MEIFIMWFSPIVAICLGIMMLGVFFTLLGRFRGQFSSATFIKIKKLLNQSDFVTVYLTAGKTISDVRFVGFTDSQSLKGVPYQLSHLVVFETADGRRILLRADAIKMIEEQKKKTEPLAAGGQVSEAKNE